MPAGHSPDDPGRGVPDPLDPRGQHRPRPERHLGPQRTADPRRAHSEAGFKTGTTNDFRDVSAFGYVPGSLMTGVWMGNNNQEPMSTKVSGGLLSADGPLFLWHEFMNLALNDPWDWNGQTPAGHSLRASRMES